MTQPHLQNTAKQGDPQAIAALINKSLETRGIVVRASLAMDCLTLVAESKDVPDKSFLAEFIRKGMTSLNPISIKKVILQGRVVGEPTNLWNEEFTLTSSADPAETQVGGGTFQKLLSEYVGQTIGINYKSPTKYQEAELVEVEEEYFFVIGKETGLKYYFPYHVILNITGADTAIVISGGMFSGEKVFPIIIQVNHLIVYSGSVGVSF
jgi:hypothetical protein